MSISDKIFIAQIRLKCGKFLLDKWATPLNSYDKSLFAGFVSLGKFDKWCDKINKQKKLKLFFKNKTKTWKGEKEWD